MKNVVFWIGVKNDHYSKKYGGWEWMDISRNTWEYWCKKNDVIFFPMEKPIKDDLVNYRINWQKSIYCFDLLDEAGIDYDQIFLVDATCMAKWDMPNVFELTDHKFTAWREKDNLRWVYDSIKGYEDCFCYDLNKYDYFSSGVIIFNKSHKDYLKGLIEWFYKNKDRLNQVFGKWNSTDQTCINFYREEKELPMTILPGCYNLQDMSRKNLMYYQY